MLPTAAVTTTTHQHPPHARAVCSVNGRGDDVTSAADFTRQKQTVDVDEKPRWKMPKIETADVGLFAMIAAMVVMVLWMAAGMVLSTDCDSRGLVAGAKTRNDVHMSFTFRCVAEVDGKWIEVK